MPVYMPHKGHTVADTRLMCKYKFCQRSLVSDLLQCLYGDNTVASDYLHEQI